MKKVYLTLLIPVVITAVIILLSFSNALEIIDGTLYNIAVRTREPIEEHPDLLLIDINDEAIELAGTYPLSRSLYADSLLLLKEFGAESVVFDIEFVDASPRGVNYKVLQQELPQFLNFELSSVRQNTEDLFNAIASGMIPLEDAAEFLPDLVNSSLNTEDRIINRLQEVVRDNDLYLGQAARIFGTAYFTINLNDSGITNASADEITYIEDNIALSNIKIQEEIPNSVMTGTMPAIHPVMSKAAGAGFPNVIIDEDGVRRRIDLIYKYKDKHYSQLAFGPLLNWLGNPEIVVDGNKITLKNAVIPPSDGESESVPGDITIPLTREGSMMINWLPDKYTESFSHLPLSELFLFNEAYEGLLTNLKLRSDWGYLDAYPGSMPLIDIVNYLETLSKDVLEREDPSILSEMSEVRQFLFNDLVSYTSEDTIGLYLENLQQTYEAGYLAETDYILIKEDLPVWFRNINAAALELQTHYTFLKELVEGSFAIIGDTATGTTDTGTNPFQKEYMNVGTHATVVNTILQQDFIRLFPIELNILFSFVLALILAFTIRNLTPIKGIIIGILSLIVITIGLMMIFNYSGLYIRLFYPIASNTVTFVVITLVQFISTANEKSYISKAFSHYLSVDVINEIMTNPDKLKLGGEKKYMTAMFTDIRGFSTISEQLTPENLVRLLNKYLSSMSDLIMEQQGTIDKYEGDAIIAFFGAPIPHEDHALRACVSAVAMKKLEKELNKQFLEEKMSPDHVLTRIGINTGDMVVGNMGTDKKMDYTIMGNSVNLAARLEGVNKLYGTWILVSEHTKKECENKLVFRMLDRVRVVGIKQPIRLYELIDDRGSTDNSLLESIEIFENGVKSFENREWEKAISSFQECKKIEGEQPSADFYIKRCRQFKRKEPAKNWDGVYNLTKK